MTVADWTARAEIILIEKLQAAWETGTQLETGTESM